MINKLKQRWLTVAVITFLGVAICSSAWLLWREWRASIRVDAELTRLASLNLPVDNASAEAIFRAKTHDEGTLAWAEIVSSIRNAPTKQLPLPIVGDEDLPRHIDRSIPWTDERVAEFLTHQQPVVAKIKQAAEYPRPVYQPLVFQGFDTWLEPIQGSRSIVRLLQLECEYAAYHQDATRALEAIVSQQVVAEAFDWHISYVSELVHLALLHMQYDTIQRTLFCSLWDAEQVEFLQAQVADPLDFRQRWSNTLAFERGLALSTLDRGELNSPSDNGIASFFATPSMIDRYLDETAAWEQLGADGLNVALQRTRDYEESFEPGRGATWEQLLTPALSSCTHAYARHEVSRKLTLLALHIKGFFLRHGTWPASLDELKADGLTETNLCLPDGSRFYFVSGEESCELADRPPLPADAEAESLARLQRQVVVIGNF